MAVFTIVVAVVVKAAVAARESASCLVEVAATNSRFEWGQGSSSAEYPARRTY